MGRPFDKHIDEQELNALVPSSPDEEQGAYRLPPSSIRSAERHVASCAGCRTKVEQYRQVVDRNIRASQFHTRQLDCPTDIDWHDVASGLWPEFRAQQLIAHAAQCAHCGPLLRAAASAEEPTPQEEEFLAQLKAPSRPALQAKRQDVSANRNFAIWKQFLHWKLLVPAAALLVLAAVLGHRWPSSSAPISGIELAQLAASTHRQHLQGSLPLDVRTDSQTLVNEWLHEKSSLPLALPAASEDPRESSLQERPYVLEGARLVQIGGKAAAYISYQMQANPVSLIVIPASVAVASGGVEAAFKKVSFHYYTIQGYKVVTWSVHDLTYALVSQEGAKTQRSCMVCHSAMRDRDLSHTPTPLTE